MTIGQLARRTGLTPDTIRFYEARRLLLPAGKTPGGYRLYDAEALRRLRFIRHAQACGMTLSEVRQLLDLRADDAACCGDVRRLAMRKKAEVDRKMATMRAMSQALSELIEICTDADRPLGDCPILAALESRLDRPDAAEREREDERRLR